MPIRINILYGYENQKLELSDKGHTKAEKGKKIIWQIIDESDSSTIKVEEIVLVKKDTDPHNIMSVPVRAGNQWKAEINSHAPNGAECKYSIVWKDPDNNTYTHDPKISIRPTTFWFLAPLIAISLGLLAVFSLKALKSKKG